MKTDVFETLNAIEGVVPLHIRRGQVLVHEGHFSSGLFYLYSGTIEMDFSTPRDGTRRRKHHQSVPAPLLFPKVSELESVAICTVSTAAGAHVLFIPRSVILLNEDVRSKIQHLDVRTLSLVSAKDPA